MTAETPSLADLELSAVVFVRDYVQLQFDGPVLTLFEFPALRELGTECAVGDAGYRDALCSRIGKRVKTGPFVRDSSLWIEFHDGSSLHVSLTPMNCSSPEVAHFSDDRGGFWVW